MNTKPKYKADIEAIIANVPQEMQRVGRWLGWRWELDKKGKWTKIPCTWMVVGGAGSTTDRRTWMSRTDAIIGMREHGWDGIGFVLAKGDGIVFIDLDHCRDPETGTIEGWAQAIIDTLDSYTEVSPSGTGVHIWVRGKLPPQGRKKDRFECYEMGRFGTMTGKVILSSGKVEQRQEQLAAIHAQVFGASKAKAETHESTGETFDIADAEILRRARSASNGADFDTLWNGGRLAHHPSDSEADMSLAERIAFAAGYPSVRVSEETIARIFRQSPRYQQRADKLSKPNGGYPSLLIRNIRKALELMDKRKEERSQRDQEAPPADGGDADEGPTLPAEAAQFPVEAFPKPLRDLLTEGAKAFPCPPDLIGVPLLALLGAAIGNSRHLEIKRTWREAPILWVAPIADPGGKKTPVLKMLRTCWDSRQRDMMKKYEQDLREWQGGDQQRKEPDVRQAYVSDVTMEALADALIVNERGLALIRDELDGWVRSMNQYKEGRGSDRQNWLSLWSGESFPLNRRNRRKPVFVRDPFVAVIGGIQPDILPDLNNERGRQDGFIHRILFAYPDKMPITGFTDDEVSSKTLEALGTIFTRLWGLEPKAAEGGTTHPVVLGFTVAGKRHWQEWNDAHAKEQNDPAFPAVLSGPWQKLVSYAARLALIVHLTRWAADEEVCDGVDEISMDAAADLINYFKAHARRVYGLLHTSEEDRRVLAAVEWIRRQPGRKTTARTILRAHVGGVKNSDEAKALLTKLEKYGYGTVDEVPSERGLPSFTFTLTAKDPPRASDNDATGDNKPPDQTGRAA